jgi:hypothetical protein
MNVEQVLFDVLRSQSPHFYAAEPEAKFQMDHRTFDVDGGSDQR